MHLFISLVSVLPMLFMGSLKNHIKSATDNVSIQSILKL